MTRESLAAALEAEGLSRNNKGFQLPSKREAVCLIGAPGEILTIERLSRIDLQDRYLLLENQRHERFFFAYEDVLGLRLTAEGPAERMAGFGR